MSDSGALPKKRRIAELSFLNIFLCVLVVFIHSTSEAVSMLDRSTLAYALCFIPWRLSAFAVQGFLLISGVKMFLHSTRSDVSYGRYIVKKLRSVFLPYVLWVIVYYIYFLWHGYFDFSFGELVSYILKGDLVGHFYFVIAIMQFYLLMPLWRKIVKNYPPSAALTASLVITLICGQYLPQIIGIFAKDYYFAFNDRAFTSYLFFFLCGCYIGDNYDSFIKGLTSHKISVSAAFVLTGVMNAFLSLKVWKGEITAPYLETVHIAFIIAAILFFFMISAVLFSGKERLPSLLSWIDRVSYAIYLSHPLFIFFIDNALLSSFESVKVRYALRLLLTYTSVFGLCLIWGGVKGMVGNLIRRRKSTNNSER